ncbi:MAG: hypothetical protein AAGM67_15110, partial [Bacteroidota bacterium]
ANVGSASEQGSIPQGDYEEEVHRLNQELMEARRLHSIPDHVPAPGRAGVIQTSPSMGASGRAPHASAVDAGAALEAAQRELKQKAQAVPNASVPTYRLPSQLLEPNQQGAPVVVMPPQKTSRNPRFVSPKK